MCFGWVEDTFEVESLISSKGPKSLLTSVIILGSSGSSTFVGTLAPSCDFSIALIPLKAKSI